MLQALGQLPQLVARQHELLQARALAHGFGQLVHVVVRENQPAQARRQAVLGHMHDAARLEAHHLELRHMTQHAGQFAEWIVRGKQNAQPRKTRQIIG